jgi:hypothetical protein
MFHTTLEDPTFRKLICEQLAQVPLTFFMHVRASIKRLLTLALLQPDPTRCYPQHLIPGYMPEVNMHYPWICSRLHWDSHWGLNLWHVLVNELSGFQISMFVLI